jgi:hypothetical protein
MVFDEKRNNVFNDAASQVADDLATNLEMFEEPKIRKRLPVTNYHDFLIGFGMGRAFGTSAVWNLWHYKKLLNIAQGYELLEIILSHVPQMDKNLKDHGLQGEA